MLFLNENKSPLPTCNDADMTLAPASTSTVQNIQSPGSENHMLEPHLSQVMPLAEREASPPQNDQIAELDTENFPPQSEHYVKSQLSRFEHFPINGCKPFSAIKRTQKPMTQFEKAMIGSPEKKIAKTSDISLANDPDMMFFIDLMPVLKNMDPAKKEITFKKIQNIVHDESNSDDLDTLQSSFDENLFEGSDLNIDCYTNIFGDVKNKSTKEQMDTQTRTLRTMQFSALENCEAQSYLSQAKTYSQTEQIAKSATDNFPLQSGQLVGSHVISPPPSAHDGIGPVSSYLQHSPKNENTVPAMKGKRPSEKTMREVEKCIADDPEFICEILQTCWSTMDPAKKNLVRNCIRNMIMERPSEDLRILGNSCSDHVSYDQGQDFAQNCYCDVKS